MEHRAQHTALQCVDCDFRCCTVNEMSRHIFATRHGARKCPECDTYIVPRAFYASLQKLVERQRSTTAAMNASESTPSSSLTQSSPLLLAEGSASLPVEPLTSVAVSTHIHCARNPNFRCPEKLDFVLPGDPRDYGLHGECSGDLQPSLASASQTLHSGSDVVAAAPPFRCMDCLNHCPTWTQVTKHIEQSGHTLPVCAQCSKRLKCFGPLRPPQHELNFGHCGFYGTFYTRRDYRCDVQAAQSVYNSANLYTGLSTLQYRCVCGVSFLHPVQLAEHLRRVHKVQCIPDKAICHCCGLTGSLATLKAHLQHPCWDKGGNTPVLPDTLHSQPENALAKAAVAIARLGSAHGEREHGLDDVAATSHLVEAIGFSGAAFLQFRPLLPPQNDEEVPLIGEAFALSPSQAGTASAIAAAHTPQYVVLYQCRECLFLFSSWDRIVQHIRNTGHCRTYCEECHSFLPELLSYSGSDGGGSAGRTQPQPYQQQQQQQQQLLHHQEAHAAASASVSCPIRSTTLAEHLKHLQDHGDIIGFPASPEGLEVLVDFNAACYSRALDPAPETFGGPRTTIVYQCPDQHRGCYKVFLHYGEFVSHVLSTGHGVKPGEGASGSSISTLPTCYPMVTYRAKFTVAQLCEHFDFVECPYCEVAVPRADAELHDALCIERRRRNASRGR